MFFSFFSRGFQTLCPESPSRLRAGPGLRGMEIHAISGGRRTATLREGSHPPVAMRSVLSSTASTGSQTTGTQRRSHPKPVNGSRCRLTRWEVATACKPQGLLTWERSPIGRNTGPSCGARVAPSGDLQHSNFVEPPAMIASFVLGLPHVALGVPATPESF